MLYQEVIAPRQLVKRPWGVVGPQVRHEHLHRHIISKLKPRKPNHTTRRRDATRNNLPYLVLVSEFLIEGGLDGFRRRPMSSASIAHQDQNFFGPLVLCHAIDGHAVVLDDRGALTIQPDLIIRDTDRAEPNRDTALAVEPQEPIELAPEAVEPRRG